MLYKTLFLILVSLFSCNPKANNFPANSGQKIPPDTLIKLERGLCFGSCPAYTLTIKADGSVIFEGRKFVKKTGPVESKISAAQVAELIGEFEKINYFSLPGDFIPDNKENCGRYATDMPSATTSIRMNGKSKEIYHYYGCEKNPTIEKLSNLEARIDAIVNSAQWIK